MDISELMEIPSVQPQLGASALDIRIEVVTARQRLHASSITRTWPCTFACVDSATDH